MMQAVRSPLAASLALSLTVFSCTPKLDAPREATRLSGVVIDVPAPTDAELAKAQEAPVAPSQSAMPIPTPRLPKAPPVHSYPVLNHLPVGVAIYEACSPLLYFMKKCPGRFLGEAKIKEPGPFVVEVDTHATEILVYGFRGFLGPEQQQEACAEARIPIGDASKPITLSLLPGTCSIKLERRYG
jgi:hypothetical protein